MEESTPIFFSLEDVVPPALVATAQNLDLSSFAVVSHQISKSTGVDIDALVLGITIGGTSRSGI